MATPKAAVDTMSRAARLCGGAGPVPWWNNRFVLYPVVGLVCFAWVLTSLATDGRSNEARLGGDFPAFYSAGEMVRTGSGDQLYDRAAQAAFQTELPMPDGVLPFAYPAQVAIAYAPWSALPYALAFYIHTWVMVGALALTWLLLRPVLEQGPGRILAMTTASIFFLPIFGSLFGGQNTALSILLLAATWRLWHDDRDAAAGVALSLLLFKPQFAIPLIGVAIIARRWRTVATVGAGAALTAAFNTIVLGPEWLGEWTEYATEFVGDDAILNAENAVSLDGFLPALFSDTTFVTATAWMLIALISLSLVWLWWPSNAVALNPRMLATVAALPIISPHTMAYDAGLLILPAVGFMFTTRSPRRRAMLVLWLVVLVDFSSGALGFTPLALVAICVFGICYRSAVNVSVNLSSRWLMHG